MENDCCDHAIKSLREKNDRSKVLKLNKEETVHYKTSIK